MRIIKKDSYEAMSLEAAKLVAGQVILKPTSVLGLATGSTPLGMYHDLVRMHHDLGLDFSQAVSFNLDEYIGLPPENLQSYHYFMQNNFFKYIDIRPDNIFLPDGMAKDIAVESRHYDDLIEAKGGIDMQILGIGRNAHIGFNEPDVKFAAGTHKVQLDEETLAVNARFFEAEADVPRYALSMGIKTIMMAQRIVLLASGKDKAEAVYKAVCGEVSPQAPASILQLHRDVTVIVDEEAGAKL